VIELRVGEVDGRDAGAHLREMDRGLTAAACDFQDHLACNGFSKDLQLALWRHRRSPEDSPSSSAWWRAWYSLLVAFQLSRLAFVKGESSGTAAIMEGIPF